MRQMDVHSNNVCMAYPKKKKKRERKIVACVLKWVLCPQVSDLPKDGAFSSTSFSLSAMIIFILYIRFLFDLIYSSCFIQKKIGYFQFLFLIFLTNTSQTVLQL